MSKINWSGEEFTRETEREVSNLMFRSGVIILSEAARSMARHKHGKLRMHKRLKSGRVSKRQMSRWQRTRRSAPGESPAVQSGNLRRSLSFRGGGLEKLSTLRWRLGVTGKTASEAKEYAGYLARGTSRMAARPFLRPAVEKTKRKIQALFNK